MISEKLFCEVMNEQPLEINEVGNEIEYQVNINHTRSINIYELTHKCKEWAIKDGFHLVSHTISYEAVEKKGYCQTHHVHHKDRERDKPFHGLSEPKAIFKACQWILENKK